MSTENIGDIADSNDFQGHQVIDDSGEQIGRVVDVLFDPLTATPRWLVAKTGPFRAAHAVPVARSYRTVGGDIVVPYRRHIVRSTRRFPRDHILTREVERELVDAYGLE